METVSCLFENKSKTVLLFIGNEQPCVPVKDAVNMKETYEKMCILFQSMKYENHKWNTCADVKVVALITGLHSDYTKY